MRIKKPGGTGVVSVNMTPMIDMVFNLLIFFILTSQFAKLEIEEVVLPPSLTAVSKDYTQFRNVVINIVSPDSPHIVVFGQTLTLDELTEVLKERKADVKSTETMNVILRADAEIPYEEVARAMLATGRAQIQGWWIQTEIVDPDKLAKEGQK
ncbi:MAG: biopolymer transporter ExbD [Planctomycetota bacterium]|nr:biopolymer transporter ExbD [Planctomycetota bacterium]